MLCPLQVESNQLVVVRLFESAGEMIPKNEDFLQRENSAKELSWMDRMQLKLESLCDTEVARNPNQLVQQTSAYIEKQMSTVGTNMRKFCAEFVKELLLPETPDKVEATQDDTLQAELGLINSGNTDAEKPYKLAKSAKLVDAPIFDPEGSISGSSLEDERVDDVGKIQHVKKDGLEAVPLPEAPVLEDAVAIPTVDVHSTTQQSMIDEDVEQYAHWFVSEEYRKLRLGKSTSTSSLQSVDGQLQRVLSSDSLLDWELI